MRFPADCPRVRAADVVVVGSGMAGLVAALRLAASGRPVTLLTKTPGLEGGSSAHAQGGIAAAVGPGDRPDDHAADTVAAGAGLVDAAMARLLAREGAARMAAWLADGLPFDRAPDGTPRLGREAAHGRARVLHAGGDATGRTLVRALIDRVRAAPSIRVCDGAFAWDLAVRDGRVCGVLAHHDGEGRGDGREDGWVFHHAPCVVLATGGIGAAYLRTTNPREATGDGLAMAARAGARLGDLEFVQFHPTALAVAAPDGPMPLLTEALRGEGAPLLDALGRRFMPDEHPLAELAPRDVVARAVWRRVAEGRPVYLDLRAVLAGGGAARFPTVASLCEAAGLDPRRAPVPVAPAAHYHMGGVVTDARGRASVAGLWACGEVANTGVHGANRLASNSLLEAVVFADRVAGDLARARGTPAPAVAVPAVPRVPGGAHAGDLARLTRAVREELYARVGLRRDGAGLAAAGARLRALAEAAEALPASGTASGAEVARAGELRNALLVARLVAFAAANRRESRGAHCRDDHPGPGAGGRQFLTLDDLRAEPAGRPATAPPAQALAL